MCRILVVSSSGRIPDGLPRAFRNLADSGRTPFGTKEETLRQHQPTGHRGGWGIAVSREGKWQGEPQISDVDRAAHLGDASLDGSGFSEAIDSFDLAGPGVLIAHLRRPSFGTACNRNTHPFREGKYVFCHNGAVSSLKHEDRGTENESLKNDSWALFQKILGRIRGGESAEAAVLDTIAEVHAGDQQLPDDQKYTSLTSVLSDGKDVWVVRDVNSNRANPNAEYFTILLSTSTDLPGVAVACQEPIQLAKGMPYLSWKPMKTRELVVLRDGAIVKREPISD